MHDLIRIQELSDKVLVCQFDPVFNNQAVELYTKIFIENGFKVISIGRGQNV
jgi:hypothetical protein